MKTSITFEKVALKPEKYKLTGAGQKALSKVVTANFQRNSEKGIPLNNAEIQAIQADIKNFDANPGEASKYFAKR